MKGVNGLQRKPPVPTPPDLGQLPRAQGTFYELEHDPPDDVFDRDTHAQYDCHAHRGAGEHGHFHTFLRAPGMPEGAAPTPYTGEEIWPQGADAISHRIAISMDAFGRPIGPFAVNRWVSIEAWQSAHPESDVFEDRQLEVTGELLIRIDAQIAALTAAPTPSTDHHSPCHATSKTGIRS